MSTPSNATKCGTYEASEEFIEDRPFRDVLTDAWTNGFDAALRDYGLDPVRVDRDVFTEKICDRIIVEIRRSQLVVADFTFQRPNVYYEADLRYLRYRQGD